MLHRLSRQKSVRTTTGKSGSQIPKGHLELHRDDGCENSEEKLDDRAAKIPQSLELSNSIARLMRPKAVWHL